MENLIFIYKELIGLWKVGVSNKTVVVFEWIFVMDWRKDEILSQESIIFFSFYFL